MCLFPPFTREIRPISATRVRTLILQVKACINPDRNLIRPDTGSSLVEGLISLVEGLIGSVAASERRRYGGVKGRLAEAGRDAAGSPAEAQAEVAASRRGQPEVPGVQAVPAVERDVPTGLWVVSGVLSGVSALLSGVSAVQGGAGS